MASQVAVCAAEAYDKEVGILAALNLELGYLERNLLNLSCACLYHAVVVGGVIADGTCSGALLKAADAVCEAGSAGYGPIAHVVLGVALVGAPAILHFGCHIRGNDGGVLRNVGQTPCCRTVGDECVGEQDDGSHVLNGYLARAVCGIEAVCG